MMMPSLGFMRTGPAMRPETLRPSFMLAVTGGGGMWQDGVGSLPAGAGAPVARIAAASGFGIATQSAAAARPILSTALTALAFDGVDDCLVSNNPGHGNLREVHIAVKLPTSFNGRPDTYQTLFGSRSGSNTEMSFTTIVWRLGRHELWARAGTASLELTSGIDALMGGWHVLGFSHDGTVIRAWLNGTQIGEKAQTGAASSSRPSFIGSLNAGGTASTPFGGEISALLDFPRILTGDERNLAVAYLRGKLPS